MSDRYSDGDHTRQIATTRPSRQQSMMSFSQLQDFLTRVDPLSFEFQKHYIKSLHLTQQVLGPINDIIKNSQETLLGFAELMSPTQNADYQRWIAENLGLLNFDTRSLLRHSGVIYGLEPTVSAGLPTDREEVTIDVPSKNGAVSKRPRKIGTREISQFDRLIGSKYAERSKDGALGKELRLELATIADNAGFKLARCLQPAQWRPVSKHNQKHSKVAIKSFVQLCSEKRFVRNFCRCVYESRKKYLASISKN